MRVVAASVICCIVGLFVPAQASATPVAKQDFSSDASQLCEKGAGVAGSAVQAIPLAIAGTVVGPTATAVGVNASLTSAELLILSGQSSAAAYGVAGGGTAVATGTATTSAAITGATSASIGTGGAVLAVAAGLTAFCGTLLGLNHVFGRSTAEVDDIPVNANVANSGLVPCYQVGVPWEDGASWCASVSWNDLVSSQSVERPSRLYYSGGAYANQLIMCYEAVAGCANSWANNNGNYANLPANPLVIGQDTGFIDPPYWGPARRTVKILCGGGPYFMGDFCGVTANARFQILTGGLFGLYSVLQIDPAIQARGRAMTLRGKSVCRESNGDLTTRTIKRAYFEGIGKADFAAPACEAGEVPWSWELRRGLGLIPAANPAQAVPATDAYIPNWDNQEILQQWALPEETRLNTTTRACWIVDATACPIWELTPSDPNVRIGGPGGLEVPRNSPTIGTTLATFLSEAPNPSDNPVATTVPNPSTTAVTTSSVPATTTTLGVGSPGTPPPPPPVGEGGGGVGWGSCMDDQTEDASIDNNWSFGSVASYIVKWAVAPIICAVYWLVVPPDGWAAEWDMLSDSVGELPAFQAFFGAVGGIAFEDLGCQPLDFRPQVGNLRFGDASIDFALCDSYPLRLVWIFFIGLGVLGVLYSGVKSITKMTNSFDKK